MSSAKIPPVYLKAAPGQSIDASELDSLDDQKSFQIVRVLFYKPPEKPRPEVRKYPAKYNKWSFSNAFEFDHQWYLIPTFLGNWRALMFEWEISQDLYREPTKAWLGEYCVWYAGEKAVYLCKQDRSKSGGAGPVHYDNARMPGPREKGWFGEEMERIWHELTIRMMVVIGNQAYDTPGPASPCTD